MTVSGSNLINTSPDGAPTSSEDRPFSFAMGTQIFINPPDDPTDAVVEFGINADLVTTSITAGESNLCIGIATDAQLNDLSAWNQSRVSNANPNIFAVGFGRSITNAKLINLNIEGSSEASISRSEEVELINDVDNLVQITAHGFSVGDRVRVSSTGDNPGGLFSSTPYYVSNVTDNTFKFALSYSDAISGSELNIQSAGSGTITVASDEVFTLTRAGATGVVTLTRGDVTVGTFSNPNPTSPLRLFYWNREQSASTTDPILKAVKVRGAT